MNVRAIDSGFNSHFFMLLSRVSTNACLFVRRAGAAPSHLEIATRQLAWSRKAVPKPNKKLIIWLRNYAALLEYGKEHGHCNVPCMASYKCVLHGLGEDGSDYQYSGKLGYWLGHQRQLKKGHRGTNKLLAYREFYLQTLVDQGDFVI